MFVFKSHHWPYSNPLRLYYESKDVMLVKKSNLKKIILKVLYSSDFLFHFHMPVIQTSSYFFKLYNRFRRIASSSELVGLPTGNYPVPKTRMSFESNRTPIYFACFHLVGKTVALGAHIRSCDNMSTDECILMLFLNAPLKVSMHIFQHIMTRFIIHTIV